MARRWLTCAVLLVGVVLHLPAVRVAILNEDEALYATTAAAMAQGEPPYVAGVESKPPGVFYLYRAAFAVVGRYHMEALHALTILWVLATGLVLWRLVGPRAGPWAALFYYVFTTVQEPQVLATQCELLYALPLALAALLARRPTAARVVAAGVLVALATLIKPTAVSLLGALGLWLTWQRPRALLGLAAGFAATWAAAWVYFSHLGVWDALVYYAFRWTTEMYVPTGFAQLAFAARFFLKVGPWAAALVVPWVLAFVAWRRRGERHDALVQLLVLWMAAALALVCLGGRFYDHYFPAVVTPLAALAGLGAAEVTRPRALRLIAVGTALPALACLALALDFEAGMRLLGDHGRGPYLEVSRYLREHTGPDDRVFVWGYFPLIYVAADRLAATRYVGCHYLTGYAAIGLGQKLAPEVEDRLQVPGGFTQLLADLEEHRPPYLVDTAPADLHHWARYPLARYPQLADYVAAHYVREAEIEHTIIYRRRSSS
jgi:hypothetical protein